MPATSRRARRGWRRGCAASRGHGAWRQPHRRPASTVAASSFRLRPRATPAHDQPAEEADRHGDKRQQQEDRKRVVSGEGVSGRLDLGGRRHINKKNKTHRRDRRITLRTEHLNMVQKQKKT